MFPQQLTRATQEAVYAIARAYGFQQFNLAAGGGKEDQVWVTATAGLAADQLTALLRDAVLRRAAVHGAALQLDASAAVKVWREAILDVHKEYFEEYDRWARKLCLPRPELQQRRFQDARQPQQQSKSQDAQAAESLLELALQFCIYTEAANLRHTPHLLFLTYYIMRSSCRFAEVLAERLALPQGYQPGQPLLHTHWLYWARLHAADFPAAIIAPRPSAPVSGGSSTQAGAPQQQQQQEVVAGACDITAFKRCLLQQLSQAAPGAFGCTAADTAAGSAGAAGVAGGAAAGEGRDVYGDTDQPRHQWQQQQWQALKAAARAVGAKAQQLSPGHKAWVDGLLTELAPGWDKQQQQQQQTLDWRQQQQTYLRLVVQPLFFFLAEQIDLAGQQAEEEPALRIAYCDVNESCCSPAAVYRLLKILKQQYSGDTPANDLWDALRQVMDPSVPVQPRATSPLWQWWTRGKKEELPEYIRGRYPRDQKRTELLSKLDLLGSPAGASGQGPEQQQPSTLTVSGTAALASEATALQEVYALAKRGADWWAQNLFRHKTYVEARTVANPFVAFWRVYACHAALLTAMAALAYVWHERDTTAAIPWIRLVAALLLSTVTDSMMRVLRALAHLMLLAYRIPVKRKVGKTWKLLDPFPPGSFGVAVSKVLLTLAWLVWTAVLAIAVVPVLIEQPLSFYQPLELWLQTRLLWLAPAGAHVVFVWGHALLCQRPGYTTSLWQDMVSRKASTLQQQSEGLKAALSNAGNTGPRAYCAADPAIDALFFPARNLVIDRSRWLGNAGLWVAVLLIKVAFELPLVLYPLVSLMSTIVKSSDSYLSNALDQQNAALKAVSHATTLAALAVPVILLSFSDTGLIFSLVGAAVSAVEGFQKGVGSIKTWSELVSRFEALLQGYQLHCVSASGVTLHLHSKEEMARPQVNLCTQDELQEVSMSALAAGWNALTLDLRERDLLNNSELAALMFEQLQLTHSQKKDLVMLHHVRKLGLTSVLPARCFMAGAVPELASGVVGSTHHLWVARSAWGWLLWVAWQTGLLYNQNDIQESTFSNREPEAATNMQHLADLKLLHPPRTRQQIERWQELLTETIALLKLLSSSKTCPSNTAAAAAAVVGARGLQMPQDSTQLEGLLHGVPAEERDRRAAWRKLSGHMDRLLVLLDKELQDVEKLISRQGGRVSNSGGSSSSGGGIMSQLFGYRQADITPGEYQKARRALQSLRKRWQDLHRDATLEAMPQQKQHGIRNMQEFRKTQEALRMQVLQHIAVVGGVSNGPAQVCRWLTDVLTMFQGDTQPADEEATRFIVSFASSLSDPGLGAAPSIADMPSLTTLVPHYDEDVLYSLSQDDAMQDLGIQDPSQLSAASRAKMLYLMTPEGASTDTLAYLRSVYNSPGQPRTQWANLVERVQNLAAAQGIKGVPKAVNEYHFLPGGPLHPLKEELLLWASWRGQLLARTVRGLMSYRRALQALADYENPSLLPPEQQELLETKQETHRKNSNYEQQLQRSLQQQGAAGAATWLGQASPLQQRLQVVQQRLQALGQELPPLQQQQQQCDALRGVLLDDLVDCKYHLVVSSQNFGVFASAASAGDLKARWLVHSMHLLRNRHPTLKVAYIDKQKLVELLEPGCKLELFRQASVLLASRQQQQHAAAAGLPVQQEAYRVLLPINFESARGVVIGEGKPENQNHALPFCPGEALQTIDCNQDSIVAEGLKLRNLLAELLPDGWDSSFRSSAAATQAAAAAAAAAVTAGGNEALLQRIPQGKGRVALVGFKEWIFSEDSGALAEFAAATERSFGTTVQRLMYNPGACRFHYGHPDVWRRSFVSTCGGVSKANKSLHVSEDVFGGYNVMLRGRDIKFVDYIAVGKGRDMGLETVNTFEAKIAAGNGEQVLSRDVRRLAHNMDFTRLLTWYHTGNGFFINTALTMVSVHASLWAYLLLSLDKSSNPEVQKYLSAVQVLQLGTLSVGVYMFTLALESGLLSSLFTILRQVLQGSLMFYIFRAQTSAYSFSYDLMFGGAKYLATGRGYKLAPTSFKDLYRRFGRSHFYFGAVLLQYLVACIAAGHLAGNDLFVLWAQFLVVLSLLFGPFFFTPFAFKTALVTAEFTQLQQWFMSPSPQTEHSWQAWNQESWRTADNASGKQLGRGMACIRAHLLKLPTLVMVLAAVARMKGTEHTLPKWAVALILSGGVVLMVSGILASRLLAARTALKSQVPRVLNLLATLVLAGGIAVAGWATSGQSLDAQLQLSTFSNIFLVFFGTILLLRLLPLVHYSVLGKIEGFRDVAGAVYYFADVILVYFLNGLRFVLSLFDIMTGIQAQLLFNTAYARQVMADQQLDHSKLPELIKEALLLKRRQRAQLAKQQ